MASISIEGVTKVFRGGVVAVDNVSIEVGDGEFLVLVGPSGCGKTTLLRIVAGLEEVTDGEVLIGDTLVTDMPPRDRDVAMVFQNYALYPHMTVSENLSIGLRLRRRPKPEVKERVAEVAHVLGLDQLLDRRPAELSGGQRQRVAMGRAMVREPQAFLMDEPLSNLDAKLRVQMRAELARLRDRLRTTTVYVTHDQIEAMTLGDRVAVMRSGMLQLVGSPMELYNDPVNLFVAGFIGSPAMNFLPATVKSDTVSSPFGDLRLPDARRRRLQASGGGERTVIIGIRPEHFEDAELVGDKRDQGTVFKATVDLLESLGSDKYAYFTVKSERASARHLEELAEDAGGVEMATEDGVQVTARLDAASDAKEDQELEFWLDLRRVHVFDPESGENLTVDTVEGGDEADRQAEEPAKLREAEPQGAAAEPPRTEAGPGGAAEEEPAPDA